VILVATKAELKELAQGIMRESVAARLLGLLDVADHLERAFDDVVYEEQVRAKAEEKAEGGL